MYLFCVYPPHFHIREICEQFAGGIAGSDGGSALEILGNHLPSASAGCTTTCQAKHSSMVLTLMTRQTFSLSTQRYICVEIAVAASAQLSAFPIQAVPNQSGKPESNAVSWEWTKPLLCVTRLTQRALVQGTLLCHLKCFRNKSILFGGLVMEVWKIPSLLLLCGAEQTCTSVISATLFSRGKCSRQFLI